MESAPTHPRLAGFAQTPSRGLHRLRLCHANSAVYATIKTIAATARAIQKTLRSKTVSARFLERASGILKYLSIGSA